MTAARPLAADLSDGQGTWEDRALCAQTDPEAFYPEKGGSARAAKRVCAACEVIGECLEWALIPGNAPYGVWGGLAENERRKLKRRTA